MLKGERWNSKIREEAKEVGKKEGNGNYSMREGEQESIGHHKRAKEGKFGHFCSSLPRSYTKPSSLPRVLKLRSGQGS